MTIYQATFGCLLAFTLSACSEGRAPLFKPQEVIDLGALVTEDLPQRVWGKAYLDANNLDRPNVFEIVKRTAEIGGSSISASNAFYTLANHGGPHVDAPNHMGFEAGIDGYPIGAFSGPLKVFDVRGYPKGRTVPKTVFSESSIDRGDVVMIYTDYSPPQTDEAFPETITLTPAAAEYLATIPVGAIATDAFSVANLQDRTPVDSDDPAVKAVPIHHAFLSRGIPIYEQLFNVAQTLGKERMYFVGAPLNIRDGDGMIVRPVVFVY